MSWMAVAEKDFRDAIRSRLLIGLTGLFVLFAAGASYVVANISPPRQVQFTGQVTTLALIIGLVGATAVFIPLVSIAVSYRSLAGERESGSLKLLLSLPNSRADVVVGKFVGRSAVVSVALLLGFAVGLVVTAVLADAFSPLEYLAFVGISLLFAFVFIAITVGISAFTASASRAAYGAFGLFVIFQFLWGTLGRGVAYVLNGFSFKNPPQYLIDGFQVFISLDPTRAYSQATVWVVRRLADAQQQGQGQQAAGDAFYLQDWFGFVVLAVWIVLPLAVGYLRFESSDL